MKPTSHNLGKHKSPFKSGSVPIGFLNLEELDRTDSEPNHGEHWSIPWSDLMMVMFVLFAALVTVQAMKQKEIVEAEAKTKNQTDSIKTSQPNFQPLMKINVFEQSKQAISETNLENVEIALMSDQSVKVSVQGEMFFELGKAELRPPVKKFLDRLALVIRQTPYQVNVVGHTDDAPINNDVFPSNWELSLNRASQVTRYLIQYGKVKPERFTVMGKSKYQPSVPNKDEQTRALNRRVEIIITRDPIPVLEGARP